LIQVITTVHINTKNKSTQISLRHHQQWCLYTWQS